MYASVGNQYFNRSYRLFNLSKRRINLLRIGNVASDSKYPRLLYLRRNICSVSNRDPITLLDEGFGARETETAVPPRDKYDPWHESQRHAVRP